MIWYEIWPTETLAGIITALKNSSQSPDASYQRGWVDALDALRVAIGATTEEERQALERKGNHANYS